MKLVLTLLYIIQVILAASQQALELTERSSNSPSRVIEVANADLAALFHHQDSLNDEKTKYNRDFWTLLTITSTNPRHECHACVELQKMLSSIAKSWYADHEDIHSLYFVNVDLIDHTNADIFKHLNVTTIPHIWLIPPTNDKEVVQKDDRYEDVEEEVAEETEEAKEAAAHRAALLLAPYSILYENRMEFTVPNSDIAGQALALANFISQSIQKPIVLREEDQLYQFAKNFGVTLAIIILIKKKGPKAVTANLQRSNAYKFLTIVFLLACISGWSFTSMNKVPFLAQNEQGQVIYISGGQHYQFGFEIVLIGSTYFSLACSLLCLIYLGNYKVRVGAVIENELMKCLVVVINTLVTYILYSCLTSIVLRKDHGYPYHFSKLF